MSNSEPFASSELGRRLMVYKPIDEGISSLVIMVLGLFLTILGPFMVTRSSSDQAFGFWFLTAVGALLVVGNIMRLGRWLRSGRGTTTIYDHGLTYTLPGQPIATLRWVDVTEYRVRALKKSFNIGFSLYTHTDYRFTLTTRDGNVIDIRSRYYKSKELSDLLWRVLVTRLGPPAIEHFEQGQTLTFGELSVSLEGISQGGHLVAWDQVQQVTIRRGHVRVQVSDRGRSRMWARVRVEDVPNLPVFASLTNHPSVKKFKPPISLARTAIGL